MTASTSSRPSSRGWEAIDFARGHTFDALVGVGGGSSIDTAKAVNLYTTHPPTDFLDYVNKPIGQDFRPRSAQAALRYSDDCGHRQRDNGGRDLRPGTTARKDWNLEPAVEAYAGFLDPNHTRTHRQLWPHPPVSTSCATQSSLIPRFRLPIGRPERLLSEASLPGRQSDQRRLVAASHEDGGVSSRACSRRSGRLRGKSEHGAGSVICRDRFGNAGVRAARNGVSSGRRRQAVSRAWLPERPRAGAARFFSDSQRACRVCIHRCGKPRAASRGCLGTRCRRVTLSQGRCACSPIASRGSCSAFMCRMVCTTWATRQRTFRH